MNNGVPAYQLSINNTGKESKSKSIRKYNTIHFPPDMARHSSTAKLKNIFSHSEVVESLRELLCEPLESRRESRELLRDNGAPAKSAGGLDTRSTGHL